MIFREGPRLHDPETGEEFGEEGVDVDGEKEINLVEFAGANDEGKIVYDGDIPIDGVYSDEEERFVEPSYEYDEDNEDDKEVVA